MVLQNGRQGGPKIAGPKVKGVTLLRRIVFFKKENAEYSGPGERRKAATRGEWDSGTLSVILHLSRMRGRLTNLVDSLEEKKSISGGKTSFKGHPIQGSTLDMLNTPTSENEISMKKGGPYLRTKKGTVRRGAGRVEMYFS